jgi:hypothetical protein
MNGRLSARLSFPLPALSRKDQRSVSLSARVLSVRVEIASSGGDADSPASDLEVVRDLVEIRVAVLPSRPLRLGAFGATKPSPRGHEEPP